MTARNKFGVHVVGYGSTTDLGADLRRSAEKGQPFGLVMCMKTKGAGGEAHSYSRNTHTMFRTDIDDRDFPHTADGSWTWANSAECKKSALDWMCACDLLWQGERDNFDSFLFMNEPNPNTEKIPQFLEWSTYCLDEGERLGYKRLGWGGFSMGCPDEEQMRIMLPFVGELARRGHILCLHDGYWGDDTSFEKSMTNRYGEKANSSLRYRWWWQRLIETGLPIPDTAITELYAYGRYSPQYYLDWKFYLTEAAKDDKLLGVATYILGDGDGLYRNIAGDPMASMVDQALAIDYAAIVENVWEIQNRTVLDIKYFDQNNKVSASDSSSDCGAACLAMLLASRGLDITVNEVFHRTKALSGQPISFAQLQTATTTYNSFYLEDRRGCTLDDLYALLRDRAAPILLVNAAYLNQPGKANPYKGAHYVVLTGVTSDGFLIHDPNGLPNTIQPNLAEAWGNCHLQGNPDFAMLVLREGVTPAPAPVPAPIPIPEPEPGPAPLPTIFRLGVGMGNRAVPTPTEVNAIHTAKLDAVKVLSLAGPDENKAMIDILRQSLGDSTHIMARLFFSVDSENRRKFSPGAFVEYVKGAALALYAEGVQEFEVHNEPNLIYEGWGFNWLDGTSFSNWYIEVINILRGLMPLAKFGFPGLSPGDGIIGVRQECTSFWQEARAAIQASDFVCAHSYWQNGHGYWGMDDITGGMSWRLCPRNGKPLVLSEFSNNLKSVSPAVKGADYVLYAQMLQATGLVDAAYCFVLSWPGQDLNREAWVVDGRTTEIPAIIGARK